MLNPLIYLIDRHASSSGKYIDVVDEVSRKPLPLLSSGELLGEQVRVIIITFDV